MNAIVREQMLDPALLRMREAFDRQRAAFGADMNPSHAVRIDRLDRLLAMTDRIAPEIERAVSADFGHRSVHVTRLAT